MQLTVIAAYKIYRRHSRRIAEVYVDPLNRPLFDGRHGALLRDLVWRECHAPPLPVSIIRAWVADYLGLDECQLLVTYSPHCGCYRCPCSPGYVVEVKPPDYLTGQVLAVSVVLDLYPLFTESGID